MIQILKTLSIQLLTEDKTDIEIVCGKIMSSVSFTILNLDIEVHIYVDNSIQCDIMELALLIDNEEVNVTSIQIIQI